jgi:hypothetical protein
MCQLYSRSVLRVVDQNEGDQLRIEKASEPRTPATLGLSPASRMLTRASDSRVGRLSTTRRCPGRGATTKQGKPGWVQEAEPAWSAEGFPLRASYRLNPRSPGRSTQRG